MVSLTQSDLECLWWGGCNGWELLLHIYLCWVSHAVALLMVCYAVIFCCILLDPDV